MKLFLRDLSHTETPRLTHAQERELARLMYLGQDAEERVRQARSDEERTQLRCELAECIATGTEARNRLASSVFPLAVRHAVKFRKYTTGIELEDLVQEAMSGVLDALEPGVRQRFRFNPEHEQGKFTTYVTFWIRQRLLRYIGSNRFSVRLPAYVAWNGTQCQSRKCIERAAMVKDGVLSLDARDDDGPAIADFLAAQDDHSAFIEAEDKSHRVRVLRRLMRRLPYRERFVLYSRIHGDTLDEVGQCLGLTRERVRQIETRAIRGLRELYEDWSARRGRRRVLTQGA